MGNANPEAALDALMNPAPLTLAQIALLEKVKSPVLVADITSLYDNAVAVWIYRNKAAYVAHNLERREELAMEMVEAMTQDEYGDELTRLVRAVTAFYEMLPRAGANDSGEVDADGNVIPKKKDSATDGSPNSSSGRAEPTSGRSSTLWTKLRQFASRFYTGAGRRA